MERKMKNQKEEEVNSWNERSCRKTNEQKYEEEDKERRVRKQLEPKEIGRKELQNGYIKNQREV